MALRRFKDRIALGLGVVLVLLTLLVLLDVQLELGYTRLQDENSPRGQRTSAGNHPIFNLFKRKWTDAPSDAPSESAASTEATARDSYSDLTELLDESSASDETQHKILVFENGSKNGSAPTLKEIGNMNMTESSTVLDHFHAQITASEMYSEDSWKVVSNLLSEIALRPIVSAIQKPGGTQLKLVMTYDNDMKSLLKPMRFPRDRQTLPNHFYFSDFERHTAEIAAFHLDHVLGFRRAMPVTGRLLNITTEIFAVADSELMHTAFTSPANNLCFHGKCSYYCDTGHAICGQPDTLEGSLAAFLPAAELSDRKVWRHPWRRSYNKRRKAVWEVDTGYCGSVRRTAPLNEGRRLLDLVDMAVFDFLMGNMDRHHYETFKAFGSEVFTIHLDHGRGFGKAFHDELSILAPLTQCCTVRAATVETLLRFHNGPTKLSKAMEEAMTGDPVAPVLWRPHLDALDRRVDIVLRSVRHCLRSSKSFNQSGF